MFNSIYARTNAEEQELYHPDKWELTGYVVLVGVQTEDWQHYDVGETSWQSMGVYNPYRESN